MAQRISLRDYQRDLAERLRQADSARAASKLGVQAGEQNWLIDLAEAGEVMALPRITPVPLARPWFRGVANVRGNLYSVIDFAEFLGTGVSHGGEQARLVLLGERFRSAVALLVDRSLGLRDPGDLTQRHGADEQWTRARYSDADGHEWQELDVGRLVRHPDFLDVAA